MLVEASTARRSSLPLPLSPLESLSPPPQARAASASAPVRIAASASFGTWMRFIIGASLIQCLSWDSVSWGR